MYKKLVNTDFDVVEHLNTNIGSGTLDSNFKVVHMCSATEKKESRKQAVSIRATRFGSVLFEDFVPASVLHEKYLAEIKASMSPTAFLAHLYKAELTGAKVGVIKDGREEEGIVIEERKNVLIVVHANNRVRMYPKASNSFVLRHCGIREVERKGSAQPQLQFCKHRAPMTASLEDILDDLSVRFLLALPWHGQVFSERLYFVIEESYWFFLDFYQRRNRSLYLSFHDFCEKILAHNSLPFNETDYRSFKTYKRRVPVYGGIILNPEMDHVLLVRGMSSSQYFFPKGKKCKDESGVECCCREVFEEVGLDVRGKVSRLSLETQKGIFYFIFYVNTHQRLRTLTRCEISSVKWTPISEIESDSESGPYGAVKAYISKINKIIEAVKNSHFRLDVAKMLDGIGKRLGRSCAAASRP
ncbi:UNVERIFIED_CONTAM: hypothetical protein PYX00_011569 [Menopon gallinae]|uniref:Nudix hydrolase domain-containing protein n=1 Tax=Menopon gallinae TaxID=328185 RepID=A0AAW2H816_9NEOP